jgi:HD-like signal output (HDOD) protein
LSTIAKHQTSAPPGVTARLNQVIDQFGTLAGGAMTASQLLTTACSPEAELGQLRRLIEADPGLMLRVLRVANSVFYGQARKVGSIDRAVTVLGFDGVRVIAAAACLDHTLPRTPATRELSAALQRHSLCCGISARIIARSLAPDLTGEAFIAGLLHDIGCGLLMLVDSERYIAFTQRRLAAARAQSPLDTDAELQEERQTFGITQWDSTIMLANHWKLPEWLAASLTHDGRAVNSAGARQPLADCVRWSESLAMELGYPNEFQAGMLVSGPADTPLSAQFHQQIVEKAPGEIAELRGAFAS